MEHELKPLLEEPRQRVNGCYWIVVVLVIILVVPALISNWQWFGYVHHLHRDECPITDCINDTISYQWPRFPYYNATYEGPWSFNCTNNSTITCYDDDRDPEGTFGAVLYNYPEGNDRPYRINGYRNINDGVFLVLSLFLDCSLVSFIIALIIYSVWYCYSIKTRKRLW